jgi:hypothetical protein
MKFLALLSILSSLAFGASSALNFPFLGAGGGGGVGKWQVRTDFTFENISTPASSFIRTRMVGEDLEVEGWVQAGGSVVTSAFAIVLPSGMTIKTSLYSSQPNIHDLGVMRIPSGGPATNLFASANSAVLFYDGTTNNKIFAGFQGGSPSQQFVKNTGQELFGVNWYASIRFKVTIN